jgi:alkylated DNA repair dioxygenase AlkB
MDLFGYHKSDDEVNQNNLRLISGLTLIQDFISREEEANLINQIDQSAWLNDLQRRVQHYGYKYDYKARTINKSMRIGNLPAWSIEVINKMLAKNVINFTPDQLIINEYVIGQGIASHTDCEPCFGDTIVSLSLGGACVMNFNPKSEPHSIVPILLEPRSLVVMRGPSRYDWMHGITARKSDRFNERMFKRIRRVSMTFRKAILSNS